MTVFLDLSGVAGTGFFNLLTISGDDGGLGMTEVPGDPTVFQITYLETAGQPATADRLNQLVNTDFGTPIVITALNGGNDPHSGHDETGNGETYVDSTSGSDIIRIAYDVSQACGAGITLFDTDGNAISAPNPVILYHELSHALHVAIGQLPFPQTACPGNTTDEPAAEIDENVLRTQLGLCLRDVCNHDGSTGAGDTCGGSDGGPDGGPPAGGCASGSGGGGGCFIVSATTGSAESAEVDSMRRLRDRVARHTALGARLIDHVYAEYNLFSPSIAAELGQRPIVRQATLHAVVRPLLAWYALAGTLALAPDDAPAASQALQALNEACARRFSGRAIAAMLARLLERADWPDDAPSMLKDFAPALRLALRSRYAAWAILDPLHRAWNAAIRGLDPVDEVAAWLSSAPLEAFAPPEHTEALQAELQALAALFAFRPSARHALGERLLAAWPHAAPALALHGFVQHGMA